MITITQLDSMNAIDIVNMLYQAVEDNNKDDITIICNYVNTH